MNSPYVKSSLSKNINKNNISKKNPLTPTSHLYTIPGNKAVNPNKTFIDQFQST